MPKCISIAQARTKCVSAFWAPAFSPVFFYKVAPVKCAGAFWRRRLAQNVCPRSGLSLGPGIFPANFSIKRLLWHVQVHFACAGSHQMCVCVQRRGFLFCRVVCSPPCLVFHKCLPFRCSASCIRLSCIREMSRIVIQNIRSIRGKDFVLYCTSITCSSVFSCHRLSCTV